jgi:mannose-6-phosphate isomerase-like protein (cupin superfamily)
VIFNHNAGLPAEFIYMEIDVSYTILNRDELPRDANTYEFVGSQYLDTEISFIWVDMPPEGTIRLHKHPYKEIFIIQEGVATFTVDSAIVEAHAGQIIIVPADVPHKFTNLTDRQLKQIDIHLNKQFITYWLED